MLTGAEPTGKRMVNRIVVGVDGTDPSVSAVAWAETLARRVGAEVVLVEAMIRPWSEIRPEDNEQLKQQERAEIIARTGTASVIRITQDDPQRVLIAAARDADLLVIGAEGEAGVGSLGLFSLAHGLAHECPCPLAVIPVGSAPPGDHPRLLVGVDGSDANKVVLAWTVRLAALLGGDVHAVHVTDPNRAPDDREDVEDGEVRDELSALPVGSFTVESGDDPGSALQRSARRSGASVLVVGVRSRGSLGGMLLGKTADEILHHPTCPTIVVPHAYHLADTPLR